MYYQVMYSLSLNEGAENICACITATNTKPFFIGRNGTIELQTLYFWTMERPNLAYPPEIRRQIENNAGIFPATDSSIDAWCKNYAESLMRLDGLAAGWYAPLKDIEAKLLTMCAPNAFRFPLRSLEPYYVDPSIQWSRLLANKDVAVVSSFTKTIRGQLEKDIWKSGLLPSSTKWHLVQTGYPASVAQGSCEWPSGIDSWQAAVDSVVKKVVDTGASICIIGCGGMGMSIGAKLKMLGISAIVLGGATQVLFGIKGRRWKNHDVISTFWNEEWVSPSADEIPGGAASVEGGCYW